MQTKAKRADDLEAKRKLAEAIVREAASSSSFEGARGLKPSPELVEKVYRILKSQ